jgi:hypothetical protein
LVGLAEKERKIPYNLSDAAGRNLVSNFSIRGRIFIGALAGQDKQY